MTINEVTPFPSYDPFSTRYLAAKATAEKLVIELNEAKAIIKDLAKERDELEEKLETYESLAELIGKLNPESIKIVHPVRYVSDQEIEDYGDWNY